MTPTQNGVVVPARATHEQSQQAVSAVPVGIANAEKAICPRHLYEGAGGWHDGRLGQAYDLIAAVIQERAEPITFHPLLDAVEAYDIEGRSA